MQRTPKFFFTLLFITSLIRVIQTVKKDVEFHVVVLLLLAKQQQQEIVNLYTISVCYAWAVWCTCTLMVYFKETNRL
jgi:D-alanyl-lipoteichoic acid acyltransferase DltB (MBOAT superfamily)